MLNTIGKDNCDVLGDKNLLQLWQEHRKPLVLCVYCMCLCVCVRRPGIVTRLGQRLNHTVDVNKGYFRADNHRPARTAASCSGLYFLTAHTQHSWNVCSVLINHSHEIKTVFNRLLNETLFLGAGGVASYSFEGSQQGAGV